MRCNRTKQREHQNIEGFHRIIGLGMRTNLRDFYIIVKTLYFHGTFVYPMRRWIIFSIVSLMAFSAECAYTGLSSEIVAYDAIDGYVTLRIYANFSDPGDQLIALTGNSANPWNIQISGGNFYQNFVGGGNTASINPAFYPIVPDLVFDSWITIGDEDLVGNTLSSFTVNYSNFESGGNLLVNPVGGGGLFAGPDVSQCFPIGGKVLMGQMTINANVTWTCNLTWQDNLDNQFNEFAQTTFIEGGDPGCTSQYALNFEMEATLDNGSCIFNPPGYEGLSFETIAENGIEGFNTYRVYAEFAYQGDQIAAVFGQDITPLIIQSSGTFYQNPLGGPTSTSINLGLFGIEPDLAFDSWVTIGTANGPNALDEINLDAQTFELGGDLVINDEAGAAWYVFPDEEPTSFPNAQGRVLIAQLTTDGDLFLQINLQYRAANGTSPQVMNQVIEIPFVQNSCPGDYTGDGTIGSADLLLFLAGFGCESNCITDLTGDDQSGTADLLIFLSVFGSSCF